MKTTLTLEAPRFSVEATGNGLLRLQVFDAAVDTGGPALTVTQAAKALGVSQRSVYNFINRQHNPLPAKRVGGQYRIYSIALKSWVTEDKKTAAII